MEEQIKLQRYLIDNPIRELRLLDQLVNAHDDPENPEVITEADLQSKKGQRILNKLKVDEYLGGDTVNLAEKLTRLKNELYDNYVVDLWSNGDINTWSDFNQHQFILWVGDDAGYEQTDDFYLQDQSLYTKKATYQRNPFQSSPFRGKYLLKQDPDLEAVYQEHPESFDAFFLKLEEAFACNTPAPGDETLSSGSIKWCLMGLQHLIEENPQEFFALFDETDQITHYVLHQLHILKPENLEEARYYLPYVKKWSEKMDGALFLHLRSDNIFHLRPRHPVDYSPRTGRYSEGEYHLTFLDPTPICPSTSSNWVILIDLFKEYPEEMTNLLDLADNPREIGGCFVTLYKAHQDQKIYGKKSLMHYGMAGMTIFTNHPVEDHGWLPKWWDDVSQFSRSEPFRTLYRTYPTELSELFSYFNEVPPEGKPDLYSITRSISYLLKQGWTMEELLEIARETESGALAAFKFAWYKSYEPNEDSKELLILVGQITRDSEMSFTVLESSNFFGLLRQFSTTEELKAFHTKHGQYSAYALLLMAKIPSESRDSKESQELLDDYVLKGAAIAENLLEQRIEPQYIWYVIESLDLETLSCPVDELVSYANLIVPFVTQTQSGSKLSEIFTGLAYYSPIDAEVLQALSYIDLSATWIIAKELKKESDILPLISLLSERSGINLFEVSEENYENISHLTQFFTSIGVRGSQLRELYLGHLDLSKAIETFSDASLHRIVRFARRLDAIDFSLGKKFVQGIQPEMSLMEDKTVEVTMENLNEIFDQYYVLKCLDFSVPEFVFSLGVEGTVTSLADIILHIEQLSKIKELPGGERAARHFSFENIDWKTIDMAIEEGIDVNYFNLEQIEALRKKVNEYTGNVGGDELVVQLARGFVGEDITPENFFSFIRFAKVWKNTDVLTTYLL
ncbi:hypothetical protein KJ708_07545, partial [bacterium]|nr:hypothetical protein [bacterium]